MKVTPKHLEVIKKLNLITSYSQKNNHTKLELTPEFDNLIYDCFTDPRLINRVLTKYTDTPSITDFLNDNKACTDKLSKIMAIEFAIKIYQIKSGDCDPEVCLVIAFIIWQKYLSDLPETLFNKVQKDYKAGTN